MNGRQAAANYAHSIIEGRQECHLWSARPRYSHRADIGQGHTVALATAKRDAIAAWTLTFLNTLIRVALFSASGVAYVMPPGRADAILSGTPRQTISSVARGVPPYISPANLALAPVISSHGQPSKTTTVFALAPHLNNMPKLRAAALDEHMARHNAHGKLTRERKSSTK